METRLEKNKRIKRNKRIKKAKRLCVLMLLVILILGIEIVNQNIIELDCLENPNILRFDINAREVDLFGKTFVMDYELLDRIKNFKINK